MSLRDHFVRQFAYNAWANREVLNRLGLNVSVSQHLYLLSHILSAERLWLERVTQQPQSFAVWPRFTQAECETQAAEIASLWSKHLAAMNPSDLSNDVAYLNTKGERWVSSVQDILTHVLLHSAYHRGQIAKEMRAQGNEPPSTDFIHAARKGFI